LVEFEKLLYGTSFPEFHRTFTLLSFVEKHQANTRTAAAGLELEMHECPMGKEMYVHVLYRLRFFPHGRDRAHDR
jgi:hypothetical protein